MKSTFRSFAAASASILALVTATSADAGSFALKERSAKAQGLSFAGVTAGSGGLQSMGFNPAAIGVVAHGQGNLETSGGLSLVRPITEGQPTVGGVPVGPSQDAGRLAGLANGYIGYRLEEDILIGFANYAPFGLVTQYDAGWLGQFDAITSKLQIISFSPSFAWEPTPDLTLGAALDIWYVNARLTSAATQLDGDSTSLGFSLGALWDVSPSTSIGVAYQHGHNLNIPGTVTVNGVGATSANAKAQLPGTVSVGIKQAVTDNIRLMGEVQWQNWSQFNRLDVTAPGFGLTQQDVQGYDDAFFAAFGGEFDITSGITLRAGAAWDQTPTNSDTANGIIPAAVNPLATNRTARVPDEDRVWLSIGGSYDVNDHMTLDIGYSYLFALEDSVVNLRNAPAGSSVSFDGSAHILSIGGSMKF